MRNFDPHWLLNIIKTRFVRSDGILARNYPPTERTFFDNFDDLVPFFLHYKEAPFLLNQIRLIRKSGASFESLCTHQGVLVASQVDEWFGGLYALWKETRDEETFTLLKESVQYIRTNFMNGDFLSAAYYPALKKCAPYYEPWSAGLLETFCEMRTEFPEIFDQSQAILRSWLEEDYYKEYGLFPYRVFNSPAKRFFHRNVLSKKLNKHECTMPVGLYRGSIKNHLREILVHYRFEATNGYYSQLMKSNSTPAFTLLEFYKTTGDQSWLKHLDRWIESALKYFCLPSETNDVHGPVWGEYHPTVKSGRNSGVTAGFILIDVLCDAAAFDASFKKYLPAAQSIADHYWRSRLSHGLVPFYDGGRYAHLDNQFDFSISMRRLGELTSQKHYGEQSAWLTKKAFEEHYTDQGFLLFSGDTSDLKNMTDPKYNALALKGMINLETAADSLYSKYYALFKDR